MSLDAWLATFAPGAADDPTAQRALGELGERVPALAALPTPEREAALAAIRTRTDGWAPAMVVFRDYVLLDVWQSCGDYLRMLEMLRGLEERFPDEAYGLAERLELRAQVERELGLYRDALRTLARMEGACAADALADRAAIHGTRADILTENGVLEQAWRELAAERRLAAQSGDAQAIRNALQRRCDNGLATGRYSRVIREVDAALAGDGDADSADAARLRAFRAVALWGRARKERSDAAPARAALRAVAEQSEAPTDLRLFARQYLLEALLVGGDLEAAAAEARHCAALWRERGGAAPQSAKHAAFLALAARLARVRGDGEEALRRRQAELAAAYEALRATWRRLDRRGGVGFLHLEERQMVVAELVELELASADRATGELPGDVAAAAVQPVLAAQALNSIARARGAPALDLAAIQRELLGPRRGMLIYLRSRHDSHVFAVDADRVTHARLLGGYALNRELRPLLERLAVHPAKVTESDARALWAASAQAAQAVLPDAVRAQLDRWREVVVVGAEQLHNVPFACLAQDGALLGERKAIVETASLPLLALLRRDARGATERRGDGPLSLSLLACTDPVAGNEKAIAVRQPFRAARRAKLLAPFDPAASRSLVDGELTLAAFRDLALDRTDVLHLLGHDNRGSGAELARGLALRDGTLWLDDVEGRPTRGLVVISACAAGRSPGRSGDSALATNLGGALLRGGAAAVLLSQTQLHLGRHLDLVERVFARLGDGASPAEALRAARAAIAADASAPERFAHGQLQLFGWALEPLR
ncbi:MAG: CHAT domain-containing protein [Planctomycetota bacterium]